MTWPNTAVQNLSNAFQVAKTAKTIKDVADLLPEEERNKYYDSNELPNWFKQYAKSDEDKKSSSNTGSTYQPLSEQQVVERAIQNGFTGYNFPSYSGAVNLGGNGLISSVEPQITVSPGKDEKKDKVVTDLQSGWSGPLATQSGWSGPLATHPGFDSGSMSKIPGFSGPLATYPGIDFSKGNIKYPASQQDIDYATAAAYSGSGLPFKSGYIPTITVPSLPAIAGGSSMISPELINYSYENSDTGKRQREIEQERAQIAQQDAVDYERAVSNALDKIDSGEEFDAGDRAALQPIADAYNERAQAKIDAGETDDTNFEKNDVTVDDLRYLLSRYDWRNGVTDDARRAAYRAVSMRDANTVYDPTDDGVDNGIAIGKMVNPLAAMGIIDSNNTGFDNPEELYNSLTTGAWTQSHSWDGNDTALTATGAAPLHSEDVYNGENGQEPLYVEDYAYALSMPGVQKALEEAGINPSDFLTYGDFMYDAPPEMWAIITDAMGVPYFTHGDDALADLDKWDLGEDGKLSAEASQKILDWVFDEDNMFDADKAFADVNSPEWDKFGHSWSEILAHMNYLNDKGAITPIMSMDNSDWANLMATRLQEKWGMDEETAQKALAGMATQEQNGLAMVASLMERQGGLGKSPISVGVLNHALEANNIPYRLGTGDEFESAVKAGRNHPSNVDLDYIGGNLNAEPEVGNDYVSYAKYLPDKLLLGHNDYGILDADEYDKVMEQRYNTKYMTPEQKKQSDASYVSQFDWSKAQAVPGGMYVPDPGGTVRFVPYGGNINIGQLEVPDLSNGNQSSASNTSTQQGSLDWTQATATQGGWLVPDSEGNVQFVPSGASVA